MTKCPSCKKSFSVSEAMVKKPTMREGVIAVGVECPHCNFFARAFYTSDEIENLKTEMLHRSRTSILPFKEKSARAKRDKEEIARLHDTLQREMQTLENQ